MSAPGTWFHGGPAPVSAIDPRRFGDDGELLCLSGSVSIACRYGPVISRFALADDAVLLRCAPTDWKTARSPSIYELRDEGYAALMLEADPSSFDFAAPTLFVIRADAVLYRGTLAAHEIMTLDDGLAKSHDPAGPGDRGWKEYVSSVHDGDERAALDDLTP